MPCIINGLSVWLTVRTLLLTLQVFRLISYSMCRDDFPKEQVPLWKLHLKPRKFVRRLESARQESALKQQPQTPHQLTSLASVVEQLECHTPLSKHD